jgi:Rps23 Pro-64 3,4-dihydroxylase Tpa1-like proline 4-hydroxylase
MLSKSTLSKKKFFAEKFQEGQPFRHVCIDGFLENNIAEKILEDFPGFEVTAKKNEFGVDGLKAVHEKLSDISPFYAKLVKYLESEEFKDFMVRVSGIPNLKWGGNSMYGGGTHENVDGAELDPHVDFNFDDRTKEHRRLNLLVYLNKHWHEEWGGEFELHSDPRSREQNQTKTFLPIFNRAVLMETNEFSWHGFPRINLPTEHKNLSRKSLALYFYTPERPSEEIEAGHATFYIQRPLPKSFCIGKKISKEVFEEVSHLISKRDDFIQFYQDREKEQNTRFDALKSYHDFSISKMRIPTLGWVSQIDAAKGFFPDGWLGNSFSCKFIAVRSARVITAYLYIPEYAKYPMEIILSISNCSNRLTVEESGSVEVFLETSLAENKVFEIKLTASSAVSGFEVGLNSDCRELSVLLLNLKFEF